MLATKIASAIATAATATGLALGLAAAVNAEPIGQIGDEQGFNECTTEHPDDEGFAVCCVFYGGSLDEGPNHQACAIGPVTTPDDEEASAGPSVPPKIKPGLPVLAPASRLPAVSLR
jgi:hypothetical protein